MTERYDAIVIGAGHNGLACAAYLARAGRKVVVFEAAPEVGGMAATRRFAPGFSVSSAAHLLVQMPAKLVRELGLDLPLAAKGLHTIALSDSGPPLTLTRNDAAGGDLSEKDISAYRAFKARMRAHAEVLAPLLLEAPPRLVGGGWHDRLSFAKLAWRLRVRHGKRNMREFLRLIGINIFDVLKDSLDHDGLQGALAFDAVLGTAMGPRTPGTVLTYLYRLSGEVDSGMGADSPALVRGGLGALSRALRHVAERAGARIHTHSPVHRILIEAGRATGVELEGGERIKAAHVVSSADPKTTFLSLVGARHLDTRFAQRIHRIRMAGRTAKVHLALDGLPAFTGLSRAQMGHRLVIAPDMTAIERAFDASKYGTAADQPVMEITVPTLHDPDLAPAGGHVLSAIVQYAPYDHRQGWPAVKTAFLERVLDRLEQFAPGLRRLITRSELLTPLDVEHLYGAHGGHWHHGEMAIDQMWMLRPTYGAARYAAPIGGLFLCGAGAHPGGGVMGAAGRNAARALLAGEHA